MPTPIVLSTDKVFDFRDVLDENGDRLRYGIFMHRRVFENRGRRGHWVFASRSENPQGVDPAAVVIVAKVGTRVLIADEFRIPLGCREYGFPAGLVEPGEDPVVAAVRELREEAGLRATKVYPQLTTGALVSSAGLADEAVRMVFLDAEGEINHDLCEPTEAIHAEAMDHKQVVDLLHSFRKDDPTRALSAKAWGVMHGWWLCGSLDFAPPGYALEGVPVAWDRDTFKID